MRKLFITLSALALSLSVSAQNIPFELLRSPKDTVTSKTVDFIFKTDPSATATIAGESVPVYKTGAFGNRITLKDGQNDISVSVTLNGNTFTKNYSVYKALPTPAKIEDIARTSVPKSQKINLNGKTLEGAYLQFGDGEDRLGGVKMGSLDKDIVLSLVENEGELYKVRLSDNRFAYIPKEYVEICSEKPEKIVTGSIRVSNIGKEDQVYINLGERLPYSSWTELGPTKIMVNIYGAMNNSSWITHMSNLQMVQYVDIIHDDSDVATVVISLKKNYAWGYSIGYQGNNLVIKVKHTPSLEFKDLTFGLDAGHGHAAVGAVSVTGLTENYLNLKLVNLVMDRLEARGAKVVRTRTSTEQDLTMTQRKKILKDANVDILLSIHNNAGGSPFVPMGTSTYYKQIVNRDLAWCLYDRMLELGVAEYGVTGNFNFSLCAPTEYPDVLLETLFMSSLPDEELLYDDAFCNAVADKVILAFEDYFQKVKAADCPEPVKAKKKSRK